MGNIDINKIRTKGFEPGSPEERYERLYRTAASGFTDLIIRKYKTLNGSRKGRYINSDLMKVVFPHYAKSFEHRRRFNLSITNSAAVLTNEAYERAIQSGEIERCVYVVGPYGAGKSFFAQSLFENDTDGLLDKAIIYEGSITPPAFEEKIKFAIDNGVTPDIIALNPTLELSMRNIRERARKIGRDVTKEEVISKFFGFYGYLKDILEKYPSITCIVYNKTSNIPADLSIGSQTLENFNYESIEDVSKAYDIIKAKLDLEENNHIKGKDIVKFPTFNKEHDE